MIRRLCYCTAMERSIPTSSKQPASAGFPLSIALLAMGLTLSGCSTSGSYPSLERRAAERNYDLEAPAPTASAQDLAPADPALSSRLTALRQQALDAHESFQRQVNSATRTVNAAQGAAVASDAWSVAQVALAQLESNRSSAMVALADLDELLVSAQKADAEKPTADLPAVSKVRNEVTGWIASQDATLAQLRGKLRS